MILTRPLEDFRIWAPDVIVLDRDRKYEQVQSAKPHGLWFSVQADWDSWVRGEGMDWTSSCVMHKVDVRPVSELLHVTSVGELIAFTRHYEGRPPSYNGYLYRSERMVNYIDWPRVASEYPGIVIQPYVWECRRPRTDPGRHRPRRPAWHAPTERDPVHSQADVTVRLTTCAAVLALTATIAALHEPPETPASQLPAAVYRHPERTQP